MSNSGESQTDLLLRILRMALENSSGVDEEELAQVDLLTLFLQPRAASVRMARGQAWRPSRTACGWSISERLVAGSRERPVTRCPWPPPESLHQSSTARHRAMRARTSTVRACCFTAC